MINRFKILGERSVADFVSRKLEQAGYSQVEDAGDAEVILTYFLTSSQLEDAYFEDAGLIKHAAPNTWLIDLSASTPSMSRELAAVATVNDLRFVEAALAVIDPYAVSFESEDNLICFAAGEKNDVVVAQELLESFASVQICGAAGQGQLEKARHTIRQVTEIVSEVEADMLMQSTTKSALLGAAWQEDGQSLSYDEDAVKDGGQFQEGLPIATLLADVAAAMAAADDVDLILPQLEAAMHLLELLVVIGGAQLGSKALALLFGEEAQSAAYGLDWARAEGLYAQQQPPDVIEPDSDDFGFPGGYGGYSAN